jgi:hypothetical protein
MSAGVNALARLGGDPWLFYVAFVLSYLLLSAFVIAI